MKRMTIALVVLFLVGLFGAKASPTHSEVRLRGAQSYGTTGIYARVFHFVEFSSGSAITYNRDLTNGDSLTINTAGVYALSYTATSPFADNMGISVNQASTLFLTQVAQNSVFCRGTIGPSIISCSATVTLNAGDVLRAHRDVGGSNTCNCDSNEEERFIVTKLAGS